MISSRLFEPRPHPPRAGARRSVPARTLALALGVAIGTLACPQTSDAPAETNAPCKEVGQRCEFAPGKLGSCVVRDDCGGANCFVCQSQH
jgi:hypothetical protein